VLTVFLFDERESERVEDWRAALKSLANDQSLWLARRDPTEDEVAALQQALELSDEDVAASRCGGCKSCSRPPGTTPPGARLSRSLTSSQGRQLEAAGVASL
jgi:hypothetical protein